MRSSPSQPASPTAGSTAADAYITTAGRDADDSLIGPSGLDASTRNEERHSAIGPPADDSTALWRSTNIEIPSFHYRHPSGSDIDQNNSRRPSDASPLSGHIGNYILSSEASPEDPQTSDFRQDSVIAIGRPGRPSISLNTSKTSPIAIIRPGLRPTLSTASLVGSLSPASALSSVVSSPMLAALTDLTPLPSPISMDSPGPWARAMARRSESTGSLKSLKSEDTFLLTPVLGPSSSPGKRKKYNGLGSESSSMDMDLRKKMERSRSKSRHGRNRSISEFQPESIHNVRPRHVTISSEVPTSQTPPLEPYDSHSHLHREAYLAEQRGLATSKQIAGAISNIGIPTPPASNASNASVASLDIDDTTKDDAHIDYLTIRSGANKQHKKQYRPIRPLGQGTFSKVVLATSESLPPCHSMDESSLDPKQLVAIKIVEHGPAGGADEERVEVSLKREIEIMESVDHPSLVQLREYDFDEQRALLVLNYCPGGDLFDLASSTEGRELLTPDLVQRIFAELVGAVHYLHAHNIVHRDIKLENVLFNVRPSLAHTSKIPVPETHPTSLVTLSDLGLSRRIDPANPMLSTRCGSEDYAAPEILLGQGYDGRLTDAWALGVLLYALMEGRLPFDPPPNARRPGRVGHRVARCEWIWVRFGDEDGEWNGPPAWEPARKIVESLLKKVSRGRVKVDDLSHMLYVKEGIVVAGGLKRSRDVVASEGR